jgi:hypothetical protein
MIHEALKNCRSITQSKQNNVLFENTKRDLATLKSVALNYDQRVQEHLRQPRSDSDDPMDIASLHTGRNKKGVKAPLTADKKERCQCEGNGNRLA